MDNGLYVATKCPPGLRRCSLGEETAHVDDDAKHRSPELTTLEELGFIETPQSMLNMILYSYLPILIMSQMLPYISYFTMKTWTY
jgi:hypothetical protein